MPKLVNHRRGRLKDFINLMDTPGAHILICLGLLVAYGHYEGAGLGHDIAIFALGVLSRSMGTIRPDAPAEHKEPPANG